MPSLLEEFVAEKKPPSLLEQFEAEEEPKPLLETFEAGEPLPAPPQQPPPAQDAGRGSFLDDPRPASLDLPLGMSPLRHGPPQQQPVAQPAPPAISAKVYNAGTAVIRGLARGVGGASKGVAVAAKLLANQFPKTFPKDADRDLQDYVTYQWGQAVEDFAEKHFAGDPRLRESFLAEILPAGAGSMLAFMGGGIAAGAARGSALASVALMGSGMEAAGQFDEARAFGASEEDALVAASWGGLIGLSEAAPIGRIFNRFDKASGGQLKRGVLSAIKEGLKGAGVEAIQEVFQSTSGNIIAKNIYDKERELLDGVLDAGGAGGILGFTANVIAIAAGGKLRSTRDGARAYAAMKPEQAAVIAAKKQPNRRDVPELTKATDRAELARLLKEQQNVDPQTPQEAVQATPQVRPQGEARQAEVQEVGDAFTRPIDQGAELPETPPPDFDAMTYDEVKGQAKELGIKSTGSKESMTKALKLLQPDAETMGVDVGRLTDEWLGERNVEKGRVASETANLQEEVKALAGERRYGPRSKELDEAVHLYIDLKGKSEEIAERYSSLTKEQQQLVDRSQNLAPEEQAFAERLIELNAFKGQEALDEGAIGNILENYTARLWEPSVEGKRQEGIPPKFGLKTPRAKKRTLTSILEGWQKGRTLRIKGATEAYRVAREQVSQTIADRRMIDLAESLKVISTEEIPGWVELEHPSMTKAAVYAGSVPYDSEATPGKGDWVRPTDRGNLGKIVEVRGDTADVHFKNRETGAETTVAFPVFELEGKVVRPRGKHFFITDDGKIMERRRYYAEPTLAGNLNRILSRANRNWVDEWNSRLKHTILATSFYHHQAFLRSYMLAGRGLNPVAGFKAGRQAIMNFTPEYQELLRGGMTVGLIQDFSETESSAKTRIGATLDKVPMVGATKNALLELRDRHTEFLFRKLGAYLKVQAGLLEYAHLLKKHRKKLEQGTMSREEIAKAVAETVNADFGGLNLGTTGRFLSKQGRGRGAGVRRVFRLVALAPDWTESNVRMMAGAFQQGLKGDIYRAMWGRVALRGLGATMLFNLLMAGMDDKTFWERLQTAWEEGHLRWLDIDITPIYRALGYDDGKRKYFSLIGHFRDPIKFILHPIRSAKHKASVLTNFVLEALTGTDWAGRAFTTFSELLGIDDKGVYSTTRPGYHAEGFPKGGKLAGQTVRRRRGTSGPLEFDQYTSFFIHRARAVTPIPVQQGIGFLMGEIDGFDALTKSAGLMTSTTYPEPK